MTPEKFQEVSKTIRQSVEDALGKGFTIKTKLWGLLVNNDLWKARELKCLCPLGAVLLDSRISAFGPLFDAGQKLGVSEDEIQQFMAGFDTNSEDTMWTFTGMVPPMFDLGRTLRYELIERPKEKENLPC